MESFVRKYQHWRKSLFVWCYSKRFCERVKSVAGCSINEKFTIYLLLCELSNYKSKMSLVGNKNTIFLAKSPMCVFAGEKNIWLYFLERKSFQSF